MSRHRAERRRWVWVRWRFRRVEPGTVWINDRDYIELLRVNLRVAELDAEAAKLEVHIRLTEAETRSMELLSELERWDIDDAVRDQLPLTAEGLLHEPAFLALVEAEAWARRDQELAVVLASPSTPS